MTEILCFAATAVVAYLWGSLNSAIIVVRILKHEDIREHGSKNAGLTNVLRVYGKLPALITLLCDLFKGVLAVVAARLIVTGAFDVTYFNDKIFIGYVAGFFAMLGHIFPLYYGFHGGKGVLISACAMLAIDPLTCLLSLTVFALVLYLSRYVSLSSICAAAAYPLITLVVQSLRSVEGVWANFLMSTLICALIIYMHHSNISRLRAGTENRFGKKKE